MVVDTVIWRKKLHCLRIALCSCAYSSQGISTMCLSVNSFHVYSLPRSSFHKSFTVEKPFCTSGLCVRILPLILINELYKIFCLKTNSLLCGLWYEILCHRFIIHVQKFSSYSKLLLSLLLRLPFIRSNGEISFKNILQVPGAVHFDRYFVNFLLKGQYVWHASWPGPVLHLV